MLLPQRQQFLWKWISQRSSWIHHRNSHLVLLFLGHTQSQLAPKPCMKADNSCNYWQVSLIKNIIIVIIRLTNHYLWNNYNDLYNFFAPLLVNPSKQTQTNTLIRSEQAQKDVLDFIRLCPLSNNLQFSIKSQLSNKNKMIDSILIGELQVVWQWA